MSRTVSPLAGSAEAIPQDPIQPIPGWRSVVADLLICALAVTALLWHGVVRSEGKPIWVDEVLTAVPIRTNSLAEVLDSLRDTINAMPPLYFIVIWGWRSLWGDSLESLRFFSSLLMAATWVMTWKVLRPSFGRGATTAAICLGLLGSQEVLHYNVEARCYAMYLAAAAAAVWCLVSAWQSSGQWRWAVGGTVAHACLVSTHYLGAFYSAAFIGVALAGDVFFRRRGALRGYWIGAILGASTGAFSIPFYLAQRSLGSENNWLSAPGVYDLYQLFVFRNESLHVLLLAAGVVALLARLGREASREAIPATLPAPQVPLAIDRDRLTALSLVTLALALVPLGVWCESRVGISLFLNRYLLPSVLIHPICFAAMLDNCGKGSPSDCRSWQFWGWRLWERGQSCLLYGGLSLLSVVFLVRNARERPPTEPQWAPIVQKRPAPDTFFVTTYIDPAFVCQYKGIPTRFLLIPKEKYQVTSRRISKSMEQRYWPGFTWQPHDLKHHAKPILMISSELAKLREMGAIGPEWQERERMGQACLLVKSSSH